MRRVIDDVGRQHWVIGHGQKVAIFLHGGGGSGLKFAQDFSPLGPSSDDLWVFGDARPVDGCEQRWVPYGVPSPWPTYSSDDSAYIRSLIVAYGPAYLVGYSSGGRLALSMLGEHGVLGAWTVGATPPLARLAHIPDLPVRCIMGEDDPHAEPPRPLATWEELQAVAPRSCRTRDGGHDWQSRDAYRALAWLGLR